MDCSSRAALQTLTTIDSLSSTTSNQCSSNDTDIIMSKPNDPELFEDVHLLLGFLRVWYGYPEDQLYHYMLRFKALKKLASRERFKLSCMVRKVTGVLRGKNEPEQREKSIQRNINYLKSLVPNQERYDLSFLLKRIIYVLRNMAKSRPEHREKLELAESYIYRLKEEKEIISIIMSLK